MKDKEGRKLLRQMTIREIPRDCRGFEKTEECICGFVED